MTRKTRTPIWLKALNWLAEKNGQYRQARKLEEMPDERLADLGLTRTEADSAFLRKPFDRPADRELLKLTRHA
jgi:uncharacterized protein YjiS (DUF1127 family)